MAVGIILLDIVLRFIMEEEEGGSKYLFENVSERSPILPQAILCQPEISQRRSVVSILSRQKDLLASLWVGFMTAVIRTALEMVR